MCESVCVCEREREREGWLCLRESVCGRERERGMTVSERECCWDRFDVTVDWRIIMSLMADWTSLNAEVTTQHTITIIAATTHHHHHCRYHTPSPSSQSSAYTLPKLKTAFHGSLMIMFHLLGGSSGLVITGEDSCSRYRGFESQHRILEWHFHICYKNCIVGLIRPKIIEKESGMAHLCNASPFCYRQC